MLIADLVFLGSKVILQQIIPSKLTALARLDRRSLAGDWVCVVVGVGVWVWVVGWGWGRARGTVGVGGAQGRVVEVLT